MKNKLGFVLAAALVWSCSGGTGVVGDAGPDGTGSGSDSSASGSDGSSSGTDASTGTDSGSSSDTGSDGGSSADTGSDGSSASDSGTDGSSSADSGTDGASSGDTGADGSAGDGGSDVSPPPDSGADVIGPPDAGSDVISVDVGPPFDGPIPDGSVACGAMVCAAGNTCVVTTTSGGPCLLPMDGGACPPGMVKEGACCVFYSVTYACAPTPPGCGGGPTCGCAKSLCGGCMCSGSMGDDLDCTCLAP